MIYQLKNPKIRRTLLNITWLTFIIYFLYLTYLLFFGFYRQNFVIFDYNLTPFKTIWMYISEFDHFNFFTWFSNLFGNILAFMPLGFLVPLLFRKTSSMKTIVFLSFFLSFLVESLQFYFRVGGFDVDDMLLNTLGGLCGYITLLIFLKFGKKILQQKWKTSYLVWNKFL